LAANQENDRYRLHNFRVQWTQVFSAPEIEQRLPLDATRRGDCSGWANVESTVTDFYRSRGFRTVKIHSLVQPNKATEQFDLTLYVEEGK
jgi:outer membrane protein assembly factor BamA